MSDATSSKAPFPAHEFNGWETTSLLIWLAQKLTDGSLYGWIGTCSGRPIWVALPDWSSRKDFGKLGEPPTRDDLIDACKYAHGLLWSQPKLQPIREMDESDINDAAERLSITVATMRFVGSGYLGWYHTADTDYPVLRLHDSYLDAMRTGLRSAAKSCDRYNGATDTITEVPDATA